MGSDSNSTKLCFFRTFSFPLTVVLCILVLKHFDIIIMCCIVLCCHHVCVPYCLKMSFELRWIEVDIGYNIAVITMKNMLSRFGKYRMCSSLCFKFFRCTTQSILCNVKDKEINVFGSLGEIQFFSSQVERLIFGFVWRFWHKIWGL